MKLYISSTSQHHYFQGPMFLQRNDTAHTHVFLTCSEVIDVLLPELGLQ